MTKTRSWTNYNPVSRTRGGPQGGTLGEMTPPSQGARKPGKTRQARRKNDAVGGGYEPASGYVSNRDFTRSFDFRGNNAVWELASGLANTLFDTKGSGTSQVTVSFWLWQQGTLPNTASPVGNSPYWVLGDPSAAGGSRLVSLYFGPRTGVGTNTVLGVPTTGTAGDSFGQNRIITPSNVQSFHHHMWVFDGTQPDGDDSKVKAWIDGAPVATARIGAGSAEANPFLPTTTNTFTVGGGAASASFAQQGAIKEMAVYTGQAYGTTEAEAFYNSSAGVDHLDPDTDRFDELSAYWRFSDNSDDTTSTIVDQTGNGYDLSPLSGSPTAVFAGGL